MGEGRFLRPFRDRLSLTERRNSPRCAVNAAIAAILSTMSRRRWAGFLEDIDGVVQDAVAEKRLERPAVHHVAGPVEDLGPASPRATEPKTDACDTPNHRNSLS